MVPQTDVKNTFTFFSLVIGFTTNRGEGIITPPREEFLSWGIAGLKKLGCGPNRTA